jgi:hypothetical protein
MIQTTLAFLPPLHFCHPCIHATLAFLSAVGSLLQDKCQLMPDRAKKRHPLADHPSFPRLSGRWRAAAQRHSGRLSPQLLLGSLAMGNSNGGLKVQSEPIMTRRMTLWKY